jgi:hypothetical protein
MSSENFSALSPGLRYGLSKVTASGPLQPTPIEVKIDDLSLVLATDPFAFEDKDLRSTASLNTIATDNAQLQFNQFSNSGKYTLTCSQDRITSNFEPISVAQLADAPTLTNANRAETSQTATSIGNPYILGPS